MLAASGVFPPVDQHYLLQARQMQALSFAVHIPLVAFGISFPAMVLFVEWLGRRRGDDLYLTLAQRWSKVMLALFAFGVITGTVLSFEMGLLWPNFTGTFGGVFGLGFAIEGFSFFLEAIFIGIYVYGWRRLSPRWHMLSGIPIVITGFTGSLMVLSVNAWMNHPGGFALRNGKVVDVHPLTALFGNSYLWHELIHMYVAGYIVTGFVVAGCYAFGRLRGRWGSYERAALTIPLTVGALAAPVQILIGDWAARDVATTQPTKLAALEGVFQTTSGAPEHLLGWYDGHGVEYGIKVPHLLSFLSFHSWNATVEGLAAVPADQRPPVNVVRFAFQTMVGIGTLLALIGVVYVATVAATSRRATTRRSPSPESPPVGRLLVGRRSSRASPSTKPPRDTTPWSASSSAVLAGGVIVFPALALLFRLTLAGRFRTAPSAVPEAEAASDHPPRRRPLARLGGACLISGFGLLNIADATWAHGIGVVCLVGFVVLAFAAIVIPAPAEDAPAG